MKTRHSAITFCLALITTMVLLSSPYRAEGGSAARGDEALLAAPMLGRPTTTSVVINLVPARSGAFFVEYGREAAALDRKSELHEVVFAGNSIMSLEIQLSHLARDAVYCYRVMHAEGRKGAREIARGSFHTARARGEKYTFTIQADSHINETIRMENDTKLRLYRTTLENVAADDPDFHIDMGDFVGIEWY